MSIARVLDALYYYLGTIRAQREMAAEFIIKRMATVMCADKTGDWSVAKRIDNAEEWDLLSHQQRQLHFRHMNTIKSTGTRRWEKLSFLQGSS